MAINYNLDDIEKYMKSKGMTYDPARAEAKRKEKQREENQRINQAIKYRDEKLNGLSYSNIPDKFIDMKFRDLKITKDNEPVVRHCSQYIKSYNGYQKGVGLIGDMGVGKTTLMAIMGQYLIKKGYFVYFSTEEAMLDEIRKAYDDDSLDSTEDIIRKIGSHEIIMIDELGQTTSEWGLSALKRVVDIAINNNSTIFITSNYNSKQLLEKWGDSDINKTPRQLLDRLKGEVNFYSLKGKSFR